MDLDGIQAAVLHPQAELFVDLLETVLLEAIAHAVASVRDGHIATQYASYFGGCRMLIRVATAKAMPAKDGASLLTVHQERQAETDGHRFLRATDLAASAAFFFWLALSA